MGAKKMTQYPSRRIHQVLGKIVRASVNGGVNIERMSKETKVPTHTVQNWIGRLRNEGVNIKIAPKTRVDFKEAAEGFLKKYPALKAK